MAKSAEVSDVFRLGYRQYCEAKNISLRFKKIALDIMECRTSKKGGHKITCVKCGQEEISYNSCKNRHCPKCQFSKREQWILDRNRDLLPVSYFHVIFTVPHELNGLHLKFTQVMYHLLFKSTWAAVNQVVVSEYKQVGQTGMIAVMHSWGQQLQLHPHLHCIIPSGVYDRGNRKWTGSKKEAFLCSIEKLTESFKAHYLSGLKKLRAADLVNHPEWELLIAKLSSKVFNVNIRPRFSNPDHVIEYLARYSHKVAITNSRIIKVDSEKVTFKYKDYRDEKEKVLTLTLKEFIRRYYLHVIPSGFMKIRHYGILSNRLKNECIEAILAFFGKKRNAKKQFDIVTYMKETLGEDITYCPNCKTSTAKIIEPLPATRGDPNHFMI